MAIRLLLVQYAGDYRETVRRFAAGENETYYAQKYSVEAVAKMATIADEVATLCCLTEETYNEPLTNGVRAIGTGFKTKIHTKQLLQLIESYCPTHLVLRTPIHEVLRWATQQKVKTITTLADSFNTRGIKSRIRNYQLANLLNHPQIEWVGNHGLTASTNLAKIGVKADKIIPWDWPHQVTPDSALPKSFPTEKRVWEIIYVGAMIESKGIGDLLKAVALLRAKGILIRLKVVGKGEMKPFVDYAEHLQIEDCVRFVGVVSNEAIVPAMRAADLIVIPSRHNYPEGFPMTIYEAFCARTPIIASDHPMFCHQLIDRTNALIFPAGNATALATCIKQLVTSPALYEQLSLAAADAWRSLQIPVQWAELIDRWLTGSAADQQWLWNYRLASGQYGSNSTSSNPASFNPTSSNSANLDQRLSKSLLNSMR